jgi:gas vesicle protein
MRNSSNFLIGVLIGAMVGASVTLLLTPTSGGGMRDQLKGYVGSVKREVNQAVSNRRSELESQLTQMRGIPLQKS